MNKHPGRMFSYEDFDDLPASAVASALSRLKARGAIKRARKGIYYVPRRSVLGEVPPDPALVSNAASRGAVHLAGLSAANALGLTTQVPSHLELAVENRRITLPHAVMALPRFGTTRGKLSRSESALLEVLRDISHLTDVSASETADRLKEVLVTSEAHSRLARAGVNEPPRVRAMLGALLEEAGAKEAELSRLRATLNRTSRFEFGPLRTLRSARGWGAR
jgi:hypothetical protein